jgi:hypothetical protein
LTTNFADRRMLYMKFTTYFIILFLVLFSCKKDDISYPQVDSPFTVKYEITTTSPYVPTTPGHSEVYIMYTISKFELDHVFVKLETSWSKTITITTDARPIVLSLALGPGTLESPGTVTSSIYLNGIKVAAASATKTAENTWIGELPQLFYTVE